MQIQEPSNSIRPSVWDCTFQGGERGGERYDKEGPWMGLRPVKGEAPEDILEADSHGEGSRPQCAGGGWRSPEVPRRKCKPVETAGSLSRALRAAAQVAPQF